MQMRTTNRNQGLTFTGALALVFITLKLLAVQPVAEWSWLWVLSPFWIPFSLLMGIALVAAGTGLVLRRKVR